MPNIDRQDLEKFVSANNARVAAAQVDTVAVDLAALKVDFNALLAKLRAGGLMTP